MTVEEKAEQYAKDYLFSKKIFEMLTQAYIAGYNKAVNELQPKIDIVQEKLGEMNE